jgi:transmembrane sensor
LINQPKELERLFAKPEWTAEEAQWLLNFLEDTDATELKELMQRLFLEDLENSKVIDPVLSEKLLGKIQQKIIADQKQVKVKLMRLWTLRLAAACFVSFLVLSTYLWIKNNSKQPITQTQPAKEPYKNDVAPGGDKAILILANGSTVVLNDAQNGTIAQQGNTKVIKLNGKLSYNAASGSGTNEILYNTVSTPRGGQYEVELPDGSMVWLNAASSLRFPTSFAGKERRVQITGEVYFEIAKDKAMPFIVSVNGAEVHVIGTHFNVMAYSEETSLETTLLEGAVNFVKEGNSTILKPGQQSQLTKNGQLKTVNDVDLIKVMAWKNGYFNFGGSDFEMIARQLSRWYDVEVVYERKIDDLFYAEIPRNTMLSDVLKALELTGKVHFKIEGRRIVVMP